MDQENVRSAAFTGTFITCFYGLAVPNRFSLAFEGSLLKQSIIPCVDFFRKPRYKTIKALHYHENNTVYGRMDKAVGSRFSGTIGVNDKV